MVIFTTDNWMAHPVHTELWIIIKDIQSHVHRKPIVFNFNNPIPFIHPKIPSGRCCSMSVLMKLPPTGPMTPQRTCASNNHQNNISICRFGVGPSGPVDQFFFRVPAAANGPKKTTQKRRHDDNTRIRKTDKHWAARPSSHTRRVFVSCVVWRECLRVFLRLRGVCIPHLCGRSRKNGMYYWERVWSGKFDT